jgi:hypothetical protein
MEYIGIVYIWVCIITGKGYVGLSISSNDEKTRYLINTPDKLLYNRWKGHKQQAGYNPKDYFHYAIRKYGHDNFQGRILITFSAKNRDELKKIVGDAEQKLIKENSTLAPNGYNLQIGGSCPSFHIDTRKKMQSKKQAFLNTPEGHEWINKCSETQLLYFQTEKGLEQAKKHSNNIITLYKTNPEIKTNISNTLLQYFTTPEGIQQIEKQKQYFKEFYQTDEGIKLRNILSKYAKKRWENPEYRITQINNGKLRFEGEEGIIRKNNLSTKAIERMKDPERRKLLSEKTKEYFDKVGRKEYKCNICDIKCRDKTAYSKHCTTKKHILLQSE